MHRKGFTLIELLVVVAVIALLIAILLPSLGLARKRARNTRCMTNERYLVMAYRVYITDTGVVLHTDGHQNSVGAWDYQLLGYGTTAANYYTRPSTTTDKPRWCPETGSTDHRIDVGKSSVGTAITTWDCRRGDGGGSTGSYAMNNWTFGAQTTSSHGTPTSPADYYALKTTYKETSIPVFTDSVWHNVLPRPSDKPGTNLEDPEAGTSADRNLADVAITRHSRTVNVAFWDTHVENVKLPDLWKIKWSANWTPPPSIPIK